MANFGIFCLGIGLGVVVMAFLVLIHCVGASLREIQWHDAQLENPKEYVNENPFGSDWVEVLVRCEDGGIYKATYSLQLDTYCGLYASVLKVTHFAYLEEIKQTVPLNPVNVEPPHYDCLYGL